MDLGLCLNDQNDEVFAGWLAREYVRDVYLTDDPEVAAVLLEGIIAGRVPDNVADVVPLGHTPLRDNGPKS